MPPLLSCQKLSKSYRSRPLFQDLSIAIEVGERLGIIGPNGAGKSTLMKIISGQVDPDAGVISAKKELRISYLAQDDRFEQNTVYEVLNEALAVLHLEEHERKNRVEKSASQMGFEDLFQEVSSLSGGWRKRLALARCLISEPELLLLDEPTNHLDLAGVIWLEKMLLQSRLTFMIVSHDRQLLENLSTRVVELNPVYEDGCLSASGSYSDFLDARQEYLRAQANLEQALESKLRRELAWLKRGARARQRKSAHRIKEAASLMDEVSEVQERNQQDRKINIDFDATARQTKELLLAKNLSKSISGKRLFSSLHLTLCPGARLGLIGENGSGKTTLLKVLSGELQADSGSIKRASDLKIVFFDQQREQLDQSKTLWKSLCPEGDSVVYQGKSTHVATWARRFLFKPDQLQLPISYLSGGEQARILIANLMKEPADMLILDEPTNNLDLDSLEVLEESLLEFPGAVVLVSHDRFMIRKVPTLVLALDGKGGFEYFADYEQYESIKEAEEEPGSERRQASNSSKGSTAGGASGSRDARANDNGASGDLSKANGERKQGLSTSEKKELLQMAEKIEAAEASLKDWEEKLHDPSLASNHVKLLEIQREIDLARASVEKLYLRWEDLEFRQAASGK